MTVGLSTLGHSLFQEERQTRLELATLSLGSWTNTRKIPINQRVKMCLFRVCLNLRNKIFFHYFASVSVRRYTERHNGDAKPRRRLKNPHSLTWCVVLLFLSPQAIELRTGIGEKNQQRRKPLPCASAENRQPTWRTLQ